MSSFGNSFASGSYYAPPAPQQQPAYSLYPYQPPAPAPPTSHLTVPTSPTPSNDSSSSPARHRINMACTYCRTRKIRCTGQSPCPNCVRTKRCCVFEEVPDEINRRTKQRKAHFKALRAAGVPTKAAAAKKAASAALAPAQAASLVQGWAPESLSPMSAYSAPPRVAIAVANAFPSVLTPGPTWTPELDGFSSINPNSNYPPSPPSSTGSASPTPFSSPLSTPTIMHSAAHMAPRVSISTGSFSPSFEFDGGTPAMDVDDESFPAAPPPCDLRTHQAFPSAAMKRPSVAYPAQEQYMPTGNPGLGIHLPASFAPAMPADERFLASVTDGRFPPSFRVSPKDTWTTPFSTFSLADTGSNWSLV